MGKTTCCDKNGLKKGPWTAEEDKKLTDYIQKHGHGKWHIVPKNAGLRRCGKSCRLRWINYLRPDIKRGRFTFEEEETIIQLHGILGNKWSAIAARLPGRTDNEIKNYWNTHIRKRLLRMGIDPVTHSPLLDLLQLSSLVYNSSQPSVQSLLGINQPAVNPNLLNVAMALSPSQYKNLPPLPQNLEENQYFSNPQVQNQFQGNQLQSTIQEFQACTTSSGSSFSDTKLMQFAHVDQLSLPNLYQYNNEESCNIASPLDCGYINESSNDQALMKLVSENQMLQSNNIQNFGLGSVLSIPSLRTSAHLNSYSPTYVNGSTEDEWDSNMMFEIANSKLIFM